MPWCDEVVHFEVKMRHFGLGFSLIVLNVRDGSQ